MEGGGVYGGWGVGDDESARGRGGGVVGVVGLGLWVLRVWDGTIDCLSGTGVWALSLGGGGFGEQHHGGGWVGGGGGGNDLLSLVFVVGSWVTGGWGGGGWKGWVT